MTNMTMLATFGTDKASNAVVYSLKTACSLTNKSV